MMKRRALLILLASVLACQTPANAAEPAALPRSGMNGIWSGEQGVLWDTSVKPGQKPRAPFTPEYAAIYQEALDASARGQPKADPPAGCLPPGVPRIMASPFPFEIVQTPEITYILYEYMSQIRRVYMTGAAPAAMGLPTFNGRSTGKWEGATLVIETTDMNPLSVLDTTHLPTSDALKVTERLRLLAPDRLEATITLTDPKAYTEPWTVVRTYKRKQGEQILEYVCEENNRNPVQEDGSTGFIGAQ
jgi:hypothetical protein